MGKYSLPRKHFGRLQCDINVENIFDWRLFFHRQNCFTNFFFMQYGTEDFQGCLLGLYYALRLTPFRIIRAPLKSSVPYCHDVGESFSGPLFGPMMPRGVEIPNRLSHVWRLWWNLLNIQRQIIFIKCWYLKAYLIKFVMALNFQKNNF